MFYLVVVTHTPLVAATPVYAPALGSLFDPLPPVGSGSFEAAIMRDRSNELLNIPHTAV